MTIRRKGMGQRRRIRFILQGMGGDHRRRQT
jgi:hypothetical protein